MRTKRTFEVNAALAFLGAIVTISSWASEPGTLLLRARDARTGRVLAAKAEAQAEGQAPRVLELPEKGPAALAFSDGVGRLTVRSAGYAALSASFQPKAGERIPVTFWLSPVEESTTQPCLSEGTGLIRGWLYDAATLRPLIGARTHLLNGAQAAAAGPDGYFELLYMAAEAEANGLPPLGTLVLEAPGYAPVWLRGLTLSGDTITVVEDLEEGTAVQEKDITSMPLKGEEAQAIHQSASPATLQVPESASQEDAEFLPRTELVGMTPPSSIRVGTSCSCKSCSSVSVYALEDYVARGLDDEWINSWASHSLMAGSIPYRSYGAWYTYNPISSNYDICSNACCQAFNSTEYTASQTAANATAGFMLQKSSSLFRAEYSAENNCLQGSLSCTNSDLSCGNGDAGSPANGWPCLSDAVCAGQSCYGHGRGECQWGTQRWASNQSQLWNWITNHYYNDNGSGSGSRMAYITSPITMPSFSPSPAIVAAGGSFTINVTAVNSAGLAHSQIMIGASLYSASSGWISDPAHDTKVTLNVGTDYVSRPFTVPAGTTPGTYDLVVALWYDTNGDNAITGSDLVLLSSTASGAVTVVTCASDASFDWKADFYSGANFGTYIFSKNTSRPAGPGSWSDWGTGSPYPGCVPSDLFSIRWTKTLSFVAGTYRFLVGSDDGARLYVDGTKVLDAWVNRSYTEGTADVPLSAGSHTVVMEYYENTGAAVAKLDWWALPVSVPNGTTVPGQALLASRSSSDGSTIHLTWGACPSVAGYAVYYGNLSSVSTATLSGASCSLGTSGSADWTGVPSGNRFFVVVAQDGRGDEGSWGKTSGGTERGGASASGLCGNASKVTGLACQ